MKTIQQVMKNDFYLSIIKDLICKLEIIANTSMSSLEQYTIEGSLQNIDIKNRVACLLSKKGPSDFDITNEQLPSDSNELVKISECLG